MPTLFFRNRFLILTSLAVAVLLVLRRPDAFFHAQFWSEDGSVFFTDAYVHGWRSLFLPYAGYFHTLPRLVAFASLLLPLRYIPLAYALAVMATILLVVRYIFSVRLDLTPQVRVLMSLGLVLVPGQVGAFISIQHLQWFVLPLLVLIVLAEKPKGMSLATELALFALCCLTAPFAVMLLPLLAWRCYRKSELYGFTLFLAWMACIAVQMLQAGSRIHSMSLEPRYLYPFEVFAFWLVASKIRSAPRTITTVLSLAILYGLIGYQYPRMVDYNWPEQARRIQTERPVALPINPPGWNPRWQIRID